MASEAFIESPTIRSSDGRLNKAMDTDADELLTHPARRGSSPIRWLSHREDNLVGRPIVHLDG